MLQPESPADVLALLERPGDSRYPKWFLAGGTGALYAPPFPRHLESLGFWDEGFLADIKIPHLFGILITDQFGRPIRLRGELLSWRPDRVQLIHHGSGIKIAETRCVTAAGAWISELNLLEGDSVMAFLWTLLDHRTAPSGAPWQTVANLTVESDRMAMEWRTAWPDDLTPDRSATEAARVVGSDSYAEPLPVWLSTGASLGRKSYIGLVAQSHDDGFRWETSLLPDFLMHVDGEISLPNSVHLAPDFPQIEGWVHTLQQYELAPGESARFGIAAALDPQVSAAALDNGLAEGVSDRSEADWVAYLGSVPFFRCSDPHLTVAYWYRWYALRLNTINVPGMPFQTESGRVAARPYIAEGVGFFRNFVTYSSQAILRDVAWMHDPELAIGILDNLSLVQRADGSFPGHSYACRAPRDFYHSDFASGVEQLHAVHPGSLDREHLACLRRYAHYLLTQRSWSHDPTGPNLIAIFDQNETGQEYMSRYSEAIRIAQREEADDWSSFRLGGVDATAHAWKLLLVIASFRPADSAYRSQAEGLLQGLIQLAYDPESRFFCDVMADGRQSAARPAACFTPLGVMARELWSAGVPLDKVVDAWIANPVEFGLPGGLPATAASDPTFSSTGVWKDARLNCPWNGRSWPMVNSHLVAALAEAARTAPAEHRERLRQIAAEKLQQSVRLMFHEDDPLLPSLYEHYDPITGAAAVYRGYDDYLHSWIVDLILREVVGVDPQSGESNPLPLDLAEIVCLNVPTGAGFKDFRFGL